LFCAAAAIIFTGRQGCRRRGSRGRIIVNELPVIVLYAGLAIGVVFGAVGLLSGFCSLSGLRNWWIERDTRMIRSFALAMAVAIVATQALAAFGFVDVGKSLYLQPSFSPALIAFGALIFGYGMVLANGCASRAVVLIGQGNLRSLLVVIVIAITAQMTLKGLLAPARLAVLNGTAQTPPAVSLTGLLSDAGLGASWGQLLAVAVVCVPLLYVALATGRLRPAAGVLAAGAAIGLLVTAGWFATGTLGNDDFSPAPVASLTFVAPAADALQYVMLSTGLQLNFGIALVAGIVIGSLVTALVTRRFRLEGFVSARHMLRSLTGAALMGAGGAMAYGCTVGQGLTGVSTLALPSFIAVAGYMGGVWVGLRGPIRVPALSAPVTSPATAEVVN
jgi:uncharacterized membrane protein YedE/YeeE